MIEVLKAGLLMSIQDQGRFGFRHIGVSQSGAVDPYALRLANTLLENNANDAVIEITLGLGKLLFKCDTVIALIGTDMQAQLDDIPLYPGWTYSVKQGQTLSFKTARNGFRSYLGVKGGVLCDPVMGSRATDLAAGFGGTSGFSLKEGDQISIKPYCKVFPKRGAILPPKRQVIRIHPSVHADFLAEQILHSFSNTQWCVKPQSNRMGIRLSSKNSTLAHSHSLPSLAVNPGSIQLPPNGEPIVLLNDAQTTGGYPLLGTVINADLFHFAQLKPGDTVRFEYVNKQIAEHAQKKIDAYFAQLSIAMNNRSGSLP
jgi:biotin-dependent carboxylase-like uncharacterized protein